MRIKHWQGYGVLDAKVIFRKRNSYNDEKVITIEVSGNHECGLDRHTDKYDCFNWLLKRFDKDVKSYTDITKIDYVELNDRKDSNGYFLDTAQYTFTYR